MVDYKTKMCKDIAKELGIRPDDVRYARQKLLIVIV